MIFRTKLVPVLITYAFVFISLLLFNNLFAQTCCTGAVPVTGNLSLTGQDNSKVWFEIRYDHNQINDLISNNELLDDDYLSRTTQSIISQISFSPIKKLYLHAIVPYSVLTETIQTPAQNVSRDNSGLGDITMMVSYSLINQDKLNLITGLGLKLPTGTTRARGENNLILQPTLQIGTGTIDYVGVSQLNWTPFKDQSINLSQTFYAKINGVSTNFAAHDRYQFGHEFVSYSAIAKQVYWLGLIQNPIFMLKYQFFSKNKIETFSSQNTGGSWLYLVPGWGFNINSKIIFNVLWEVPILRNINGFQLTTSNRFVFALQTNF